MTLELLIINIYAELCGLSIKNSSLLFNTLVWRYLTMKKFQKANLYLLVCTKQRLSHKYGRKVICGQCHVKTSLQV